MMKTAVITEPNQIQIQDSPQPSHGPEEVLIRVRAVGICGSDTHYFAGMRDHEDSTVYPFVLGHEFAGEIADTGADVLGYEEGQRVACAPDLPCGNCEWCKKGEFNVCPNVKFAASSGIRGCLSEYYVVHQTQLHPIPDSISFGEATLAEPLAIGLHIVDNLVQPSGGESYAIIGAGPIGLVTTFVAGLRQGSDILVSEKRPERLAAAEEYGATGTCLISDEPFDDFVARETGDRGTDVAVEAAGDLDAVEEVARLACIHGTVVVEGIPEAGHAQVDINAARRRELEVHFGRRSLHKTDEALELIGGDRFDGDVMITHKFPLEETQVAFEHTRDYKDGVIKAIIEP